MHYGYIFSKDGEITGEQTVLRYSAYDTWRKSKASYREKYYGGKSFTTRETVFGHEGHKIMEKEETWKAHPILCNVMRYRKAEKDIVVALADDIKIGGRLDSFCPDQLAFFDYKFSHRNKDGKAPWDRVKVAKHRQLVFYSLLIKQKFGKVDRYPRLIWVETAFEKETVEFDGHILETDAVRKLRLTGAFEVFKRTVSLKEIELMKKDIIKAAQEINDDFIQWTKNK